MIIFLITNTILTWSNNHHYCAYHGIWMSCTNENDVPYMKLSKCVRKRSEDLSFMKIRNMLFLISGRIVNEFLTYVLEHTHKSLSSMEYQWMDDGIRETLNLYVRIRT